MKKHGIKELELWDVLSCYLYMLYVIAITHLCGMEYGIAAATFILLVGFFLVLFNMIKEIAEKVKKENIKG